MNVKPTDISQVAVGGAECERAGDGLTAPYRAVRPVAESFGLEQVKLLDSEFKQAMDVNAEWLMSLEPDRFLSWFRKEAGLEPKAPVYGGWESTGVAGHALGHYLTALSHQYRATGDERFRERTAYIVSELALCQAQHGEGYVAAIPKGREIFDEIRRGSIRIQDQGHFNNGWAPWYTMDKMLAGLRDVHVWTDNQQALDVLIGLADYFYEVTRNLNDAQWQEMMRCEFGGMNHSLAELYAITRDPRHLELADKFYHKEILDPLTRGEDPLPGKHANTQVPKLRGLAALYDLTGREDHRRAAEFFWNTVVKQHTYVNGGNSAHEHFGPPGQLNDRVEATTETCNTYNMLRLTRQLYRWAPKADYMDYYERALVNHILASQHRESGMVAYLGYVDRPVRKHFCTRDESWWCCVGTGFENHTKYGEAIYAHQGDTLYVNLFIASELDHTAKNIRIRQETDFPFGDKVRLQFAVAEPTRLDLLIRKPAWCSAAEFKLNGQPLELNITEHGYYRIARDVADGDTVDIRLPMTLRTESMPDNPDRIAFFYGPVLLAAVLEDGHEWPINGGHQMRFMRQVRAKVDEIPMLVGSADDLTRALVPVEETPLTFVAAGVGQVVQHDGMKAVDVLFRPAFTLGAEIYSAYLDIYTPSQWQDHAQVIQARMRQQRDIEARTLGAIRIGEQQSEADANLEGERTQLGDAGLMRWRDARDGGWFAYDVPVDPEASCELVVTHLPFKNENHLLDLVVEDRVIATPSFHEEEPGKAFDENYPIPRDLTRGRTVIRVAFKARPGHATGGVCGCKIMKNVTIKQGGYSV